MTTTDTTTTTFFNADTCSYADLRAKAIDLNIPRRTQMKAAELRAAVAGELNRRQTEADVAATAFDSQAEAVDLSGDALTLAGAGVDLNVTAPEPTPTADELAGEQAQRDFEATATPAEVEAQIDNAIAAWEKAVGRPMNTEPEPTTDEIHEVPDPITTCVQAALHTGVGTCACGWMGTSDDAFIEAGVVLGGEMIVTQRVASEDESTDEPTDTPAAAGGMGAVITHTKTRGVISTKTFRDTVGKRPSTLSKRAWKFRNDTSGDTRTFEDTTYRAAAATLLMQAAGDSKWTLLP